MKLVFINIFFGSSSAYVSAPQEKKFHSEKIVKNALKEENSQKSPNHILKYFISLEVTIIALMNLNKIFTLVKHFALQMANDIKK